MFSTDLDATPRCQFPVGLVLISLLAMTNIASTAAMLLAQG